MFFFKIETDALEGKIINAEVLNFALKKDKQMTKIRGLREKVLILKGCFEGF